MKGARKFKDLDTIKQKRFEMEAEKWKNEKYDIYRNQLIRQKRVKQTNYTVYKRF